VVPPRVHAAASPESAVASPRVQWSRRGCSDVAEGAMASPEAPHDDRQKVPWHLFISINIFIALAGTHKN
jgi:hypothetical protein